jgi:hypothetical protein
MGRLRADRHAQDLRETDAELGAAQGRGSPSAFLPAQNESGIANDYHRLRTGVDSQALEAGVSAIRRRPGFPDGGRKPDPSICRAASWTMARSQEGQTAPRKHALAAALVRVGTHCQRQPGHRSAVDLGAQLADGDIIDLQHWFRATRTAATDTVARAILGKTPKSGQKVGTETQAASFADVEPQVSEVA